MSKYNLLWKYIKDNNNDSMILSFDDVNIISGVPIDHSFLKYKKELIEFGYEVTKISMKEKKIIINKVNSN